MADTAPSIYTDYVKLLLDAESTRRTALEQKGSAVITTAGSLVTLLFGLVAVITSVDKFTLPGRAHGWLVAAIVFFVIACFIAILISVPLPYGETTITVAMLTSWWSQPPEQAQAAISGVRLQALAAARRMNGMKARILIAAILSELLALVMLGMAVIRIINQ